MKDYIFYLEHGTPTEKRQRKNTGNCIAIQGESFINHSTGYEVCAALEPVNINTPNTTQLCWGEVSAIYLKNNCTKITEGEARTHHPNLFVRLENDIKL